jgi:hypothetical protein
MQSSGDAVRFAPAMLRASPVRPVEVEGIVSASGVRRGRLCGAGGVEIRGLARIGFGAYIAVLRWKEQAVT